MAKKGRQNKIQKKLNSSVRTGTKSREKKNNYSGKILHIHNLLRNVEYESVKVKKIEIEYGLSFAHAQTKGLIEDSMNDELILDLNEKKLKKQRLGVKELALILNRLNISPDVSEMIISKSLNNIYIEKNIYKILPKDMVNIFHKKGPDEIIEENELNTLMKNYMHNRRICDFLEVVLFTELSGYNWNFRKQYSYQSIRSRIIYNIVYPLPQHAY